MAWFLFDLMSTLRSHLKELKKVDKNNEILVQPVFVPCVLGITWHRILQPFQDWSILYDWLICFSNRDHVDVKKGTAVCVPLDVSEIYSFESFNLMTS